MENILKYAMVSFLILPMLFMIVVAVVSTVLVVFDIPFRDR